MTKCPWCGKGVQGSDPEHRTWWRCQSRQAPGKGPVQSVECEAYCEGRDEGRRQGHLEALREVEE